MTIFDLINRCNMSDTAKCALAECIATKGPRKGMLKSKAPSSYDDPEAHAAWHGAMLSVNPYKVSIGTIVFMDARCKAIATEVTNALDEIKSINPAAHIAFDKDRLALERLGVW